MRQRKRGLFGNFIRYTVLAMAAFPIVFMAASNVQASAGDYSTSAQQILGNPLDIICYDDGRNEVWFQRTESFNEYEYYNGDAWGSVLMFNDGDALLKYADQYHADSGWNDYTDGVTVFTSVSNTKPNDWEIDTVLGAGDSGVTVTQKVQYTDGLSYYKMTWTITNNSAKTYTDCKFIHGGDTYFGNDDDAQSYWDEGLGMVYLKNSGVSGLMGFYGGVGSRADAYYGGYYYDGNDYALQGALPSTVDSNYLDAGYNLQWNRNSLAPGETWTITAYEKWTDAGNVQVMAPAEQTVTKGETVDLTFIIQNFQDTADTFTFGASSLLGWNISYPDGNTVTVQPGQSVTVTVRVAPPAGSDTSDDTITLTVTSSTNAEVFNSDSVKITATPGEVVTPEEPEEIGDDNHHNDWCFVSTAGNSSNSGILILAAVIIALGCAIRFRTADARIDK